MTVDTAIIPVAGIGTRAFPLTTTIEKCLLPVYTGRSGRPLVDYMIEDCAKAGIKRILFVTTERGKKQLSDYFGTLDLAIEKQLISLNKTEILQSEHNRRANYGLEFDFLIQPTGKYGTAVPIAIARQALKGEKRFIMMGGDDFVYHADGTSELALALKTWSTHGTDHVITGAPVSRLEAVKYAVLHRNNQGQLLTIEEKPPLDHIPQKPVVNITRHLLSNSIWDYIDTEMSQNRGTSEHFITSVISEALEHGETFQVHIISGKYLDGGSYDSIFKAGQYIHDHPSSA